jgi:hypothetical protein
MDWIVLAQDSEQWWALVNMVMNLPVQAFTLRLHAIRADSAHTNK